MNRLKCVLVALILTAFFSCNNTSTKTSQTPNDDSIAAADTTESGVTAQVLSEENDTITKIAFSEFTLTINRLVVLDEANELDNIQADSVYLTIDLGETIEGQLITIEAAGLSDIKVEQRYETSITIMNEGPHCDLIDWKHYDSEWQQLKQNHKGQFVCKKYEQAEWEKFPLIDMEELKEEVRKQCGEDWFELVKNVSTPTEYPCGVSISRYFLKVTGYHKSELVKKLIVLEIPMGC